MKRLIPLALALCVGLLGVQVYAYDHLCSSVPSVCEYIDENEAPWVNTNVCLYSNGDIFYKGSGSCPSGSSPYYVGYGEIINEISGEMVAYIPVGDACEQPGICVEGPPPSGAESQLICCDAWGACFPLSQVLCTNRGDQPYICYNGVSNVDGSVTCFEGQPY
jgi:hypothetical protein